MKMALVDAFFAGGLFVAGLVSISSGDPVIGLLCFAFAGMEAHNASRRAKDFLRKKGIKC